MRSRSRSARNSLSRTSLATMTTARMPRARSVRVMSSTTCSSAGAVSSETMAGLSFSRMLSARANGIREVRGWPPSSPASAGAAALAWRSYSVRRLAMLSGNGTVRNGVVRSVS